MSNNDIHAPAHIEEGGVMTTTKKKFKLGGIVAIAIAGLALTGCSATGDGDAAAEPKETKPAQLEVDGEYVFAPTAGDADEDVEELPRGGSTTEEYDSDEVGDLFTMTISGTDVEITHRTCKVGTDDENTAVTDARETAFGELGEPSEDNTAAITWLEGGAFTSEAELPVEVLSDGGIVRVGDDNFFDASGKQGKALDEQFSTQCGPEPTETEAPTDNDQSPSPDAEDDAAQPSDDGGEQ
jgi:hypothetical protein